MQEQQHILIIKPDNMKLKVKKELLGKDTQVTVQTPGGRVFTFPLDTANQTQLDWCKKAGIDLFEQEQTK
jgi:hypothetical protein